MILFISKRKKKNSCYIYFIGESYQGAYQPGKPEKNQGISKVWEKTGKVREFRNWSGNFHSKYSKTSLIGPSLISKPR
jgi:hypothetical protein